MGSMDFAFEKALEKQDVETIDITHGDSRVRVAHRTSPDPDQVRRDISHVGLAFIEAHRRYDDVGDLRGYAIDKKAGEAIKYHCREEWIQEAVAIPPDPGTGDELEKTSESVLDKIVETLEGPYDISEHLN